MALATTGLALSRLISAGGYPFLRVALDATPILTAAGRTGVGVLTAEMFHRVAKRADVIAYAKTVHTRALADAELPQGVERVFPRWWNAMPARPLAQVWSHANRPCIEWWTGEVDVVHGTNSVVPPAKGAGRVVTVHDLAALHFPTMVRRAHRCEPTLLKKAVRSGALIHTFSEFVGKEVVEHLGADPDRVVVIPPGPPPPNDAVPEEGHRLADTDRYILALGTLEPRKNLVSLIRAFDQIADGDRDLRLVLAGAKGRNADGIEAAIESSRCREQIWCPKEWVKEPQKAALLRGATIVAYPSKYEGFGLPLLEAMEAGVPVVTSTAGALQEVARKAALFADPDSIEDLATKISNLLHNEALRKELVDEGRKNLERFSWADFEARLMALYQRAAGSWAPRTGIEA